MTDTPWAGDACSLVDAFRRGERSPVEELDATLAAIDASPLHAFTHLDPERARAQAEAADVALPFGGVPVGVKSLDAVQGWPADQQSLALEGAVADHTSTMIDRLVTRGGAVTVGQTLASEFGGLNISTNRAYGTCHNPWEHGRTAGGSSGGSSAAVAGGLVTIASGGDGGGSIRIPAGFCGLLGMKGTAGRIPRGPQTYIAPMTVVIGCQARSVRDAARWYDVTSGFDSRDPYSLPRIDGWERDLGTFDLRGKKVVIAPTLGTAVVRDEVQERVIAAGEALARDVGLTVVDLPVHLPPLDLTWALANMSGLHAELAGRWPECRDLLTRQMAFGMEMAEKMIDVHVVAKGELARTEANERMAAIFDEVDFVIAATNPDTAFPAEVEMNTRVGAQKVEPGNNGALTIPANISGHPAVSIPIEPLDGLPVGMQIIGRHHTDQLLFDLALAVERTAPWPLVVPGSPARA
jgi:aspartyl-tRNA(Asn)/glutamyl-tRNA(Gln) amidotransferase subunit A